MTSDFPAEGSITITCSDCAVQGTDCCPDCIVSFIVGRDPGDAVVIDLAEARAVTLLAEAGLVPELRHVSAAP